MTNKTINKQMTWEEILEAMLKDRRIRLNIVKRIHKFFFYFYFPHYAEFKIAPFHEEMFRITQNADIPNAVITGFRECGKSTIFATSFPLWAIMGQQKIKFVLILSQTQQKAQTLLKEIKDELEGNELLRGDLGPFEEEHSQWNVTSLYLKRYDAKITIGSTEQSIRGIRHKQYRPQLIIADDLEDLDSIKTSDGRNKIYNWLMSEVLPAGEKRTRLILLGSLLHQDCLIKRLQRDINEGKMSGIFRAFPFFDEKGEPAWRGKFQTQKDVDDLRKKIPSETAWRREYLLEIVSDEKPIIERELIKYYNVMPKLSGKYYRGTFIGIDPAGSTDPRADCTAMVTASVFGEGDDMAVFIHPNPINERLELHEIKERAILLSKTTSGSYPAKLIIEVAGIQIWLTQEIEHTGIPFELFKVGGTDKKTRLNIASSLMHAGKVFFPKEKTEELIQQLVGFGVEKYDDLADAFSILMIHIIKIKNDPGPRMRIFSV